MNLFVAAKMLIVSLIIKKNTQQWKDLQSDFPRLLFHANQLKTHEWIFAEKYKITLGSFADDVRIYT